MAGDHFVTSVVGEIAPSALQKLETLCKGQQVQHSGIVVLSGNWLLAGQLSGLSRIMGYAAEGLWLNIRCEWREEVGGTGR